MKKPMYGLRIACFAAAAFMTVAMITSCNSNFGDILAGMLGLPSDTSSGGDQFVQGAISSSDNQSVTIPSDASELESDMSIIPDISDPSVVLMGLTFKYDTAYINLGAETRLRYTPSPINADTSDLKWVSSAPEVISVSNKGKITANAGGVATITAYSETYEVSGNCVIYVRGEAEIPDNVVIEGEDGESGFFTPPTEDDPGLPPVGPSSSAPPSSKEESSAPPSSEQSSSAPPSSKEESSTPPSSKEESSAPPSSQQPSSSPESSESSSVSSWLPPVSSGTTSSETSVDSRDEDDDYNFDNSKLLNSRIRVKQPDGSFVVSTVLDFVVFHTGSELSSKFSDEAIRAQAVTVYTYYICYNMTGSATYATSEHRKLPIDPETGEVIFTSIYDQFPRNDGSYDRLVRLCSSVLGQTVLYQGKPICAVFSAGNRGVSQCNSPYWSSYIYPYLVRVDSPWDKDASGYEVVKTKTRAEVEKILKAINSSIVLDSDPSLWFDEIERDVPDEGYVLYVTIGEVSLKGSTLRSKLGLRSNCFFVDYDEETETFTFTTHGYGHGIGMSQWGAQGMAEEGYTYVTILRHYYQGTTVGYFEPRVLYEESTSDNVSKEEQVSSKESVGSVDVSVSSEEVFSEQVSSQTSDEELVSNGEQVSVSKLFRTDTETADIRTDQTG